MEDGEVYMALKVTGTKDDELLRVLSGIPGRRVKLHCCTAECWGVLTDPLLVHARLYEPVDLRRLPWLNNLDAVAPQEARVGVDELMRWRRSEDARGAKAG